MLFDFVFWGHTFEICSIIFIICNISKSEKKYPKMLVIVIFILVNLFFTISAPMLRFTSIENVFNYNKNHNYDYIQLGEFYIVYDYTNDADINKVHKIIKII